MPGYPIAPLPNRPGCFEAGPLKIILTNHPSDGWHLSVSRKDRIPTWPEIMWAKRHLVPKDIFMVVMVPPDQYWMNGFSNVIQLTEVTEPRHGDLCWHMRKTFDLAKADGLNLIPDDGKDIS